MVTEPPPKPPMTFPSTYAHTPELGSSDESHRNRESSNSLEFHPCFMLKDNISLFPERKESDCGDVWIGFPSVAFHRHIPPSMLAKMSCVLSGEKVSDLN